MSETSQAAVGSAKNWQSKPSLILALTLVGGLLTWGFIQAMHPVFVVPKEYHITAMGVPVEQSQALVDQQARVNRLNAMLDVAVLGGLVAAALAVTAMPNCPTWLRLLIALPWGIVFGGGAGLLGAITEASNAGPTLPSVMDTIKVQAVMFTTLGAGLGLMMGSFGRSAQNIASATISGTIAGGLAAVVYPILASIMMPSASIESAIPPKSITQLLWIGTFVICVAVIVSRFGSGADSRKKSSGVR